MIGTSLTLTLSVLEYAGMCSLSQTEGLDPETLYGVSNIMSDIQSGLSQFAEFTIIAGDYINELNHPAEIEDIERERVFANFKR